MASLLHALREPTAGSESKIRHRDQLRTALPKLNQILKNDPTLQQRYKAVARFASRIRTSEYHITNACNLRCEGCWFFEYGHDRETKEEHDRQLLEAFVREEKERGVTHALVIGGEPSLFLDRLAVYVRHMPHVTVSSNGLVRIPVEGFEKLGVALTLFGGGPLDDKLRAIKPSGRRFEGLFETALENYRNDPRAGFVYAATETGIAYIDETVRRIRDNGNTVVFNFYSKYGTQNPAAQARQEELLAELLRVQKRYPETVLSHPYEIETLVTGRSHWGTFGYDNCPSISEAHPAHTSRRKNGNPTLPMFNTWSADLKTVKFCCTGGHCGGCRDSQAVLSWLLVNPCKFVDSPEQFTTWVEITERYWSRFPWSPFHHHASAAAVA